MACAQCRGWLTTVLLLLLGLLPTHGDCDRGNREAGTAKIYAISHASVVTTTILTEPLWPVNLSSLGANGAKHVLVADPIAPGRHSPNGDLERRGSNVLGNLGSWAHAAR